MSEELIRRDTSAEDDDLLVASQIEPQDVKWLWHPYIPVGKVTSLEGDPGVGKSFVSCAITAALTNGDPLPGMTDRGTPQNVLMLTGEDGLGDTIVPRLQAQGADLRRVFFPAGLITLDAGGVKKLRSAMSRCAAAMTFIDPIQLFMGAKRDINKANEVREMMGALHQAAEDTDCAVVIVRHLRKASSGNALYKGLGSIDFAGAVRSVLHVRRTKAGDTIIEHIKHNLSPKGATIGYSIDEGKFEWGRTWSSGDEDKENGSTNGPLASRARDWLREYLSKHGMQPAKDVLQAAIADELTTATIMRVKNEVARSVKRENAWWWELKDEAEEGE